MKIVGRLALVALVATWFLLFRPVTLGGPASYEVVTGTSMEPLLHTGDLVIAESRAAYGVGDLIVFHVPSSQPGAGTSVIHRIIGGNWTDGFVVQGDNKPAADPWRPKAADVVGRSWIQLAGGGRFLLLLRTPLVLATVLGGLAGFWFLTSGVPRPSREKRSQGGQPTAWGDGPESGSQRERVRP